MLAVAITAAIVLGDHTALRASADRTAAQQAVLWKGDWLEVRGDQRGWLKVYDHRHERAGWIPERAVKEVVLEDASAPAVRAIVEFLRDTPGQESLGIAYAAIYLKVAPKAAIDAAMMIDLGTMADRLAHRASTSGGDAAAAEQIAVAQSWGLGLASVEQLAGARICYDGDAFRAGLAMQPSPADAASAVLALTEPGCEPMQQGVTEQQARDAARLRLLEQVDPVRVGGPAGDALRIRRAELGARLAWADARRGDLAAAATHADAAVSAFARVERADLADDDEVAYGAAALAVAASRWAALPAVAVKGVELKSQPGEPGETCLGLGDGPMACTHGQVWPQSLRTNADRSAIAIAVQPMPGWLELWMFRRGADGGWMHDVLAPSTDGPDRGYVELAGWSRDGTRVLVVREARTGTRIVKSYDVIVLATMAVEKSSPTLAGTGVRTWASADWRGRTLALR